MNVKMVDVSGKKDVLRTAVASGRICLSFETLRMIKAGKVKKGDVFSVSEVAAINAVKDTPRMIPLCHNIPINKVDVDFVMGEDYVCATVSVVSSGRTGVEMEALLGVSLCLLNIWDMVKYLEKDEKGQYPHTRITDIRVVEKTKKVIDDVR